MAFDQDSHGAACRVTGHAVWVSAEMYSAPSIVLQSKRADGGTHVFDDFREAYAWLRHNTNPTAKVRHPPLLCLPSSNTT